jgi:hypothetical protein
MQHEPMIHIVGILIKMFDAISIKWGEHRFMLYALCFMLYALCFMLYTSLPLLRKLRKIGYVLACNARY